MHLYSIYTRSENKNLDLIIIKQGFSLSALIFNFFWAIYHKMWLVAGIIMVVNFIVFSFQDAENISMVEYLKYAAEFFAFGFFATELRELYAKKRGMELDDIILASSEEEAELKYMTRTNSYL
jgi:hypothetical protein